MELSVVSQRPDPERSHENPTSERLRHIELCICLRNGLAGAFVSRAARQLLGHLADTHKDDIPLAVSKDLESISVGNYVFDVNSLGESMSELTTRKASDLWSALRQVNLPSSGNEDVQRTLGRFIRIWSLTPIVALQLLTSLSNDFDVEQIFSVLISSGKSTGYIPHLGPGLDPKCFWYFSMKYYYLNIGDPAVHKGQVAGVFHENEKDLYICRGTALMALSLNFDSIPDHSVSPWKLLVLSCNEQRYKRAPRCLDGIEAYFVAIHHEMTWVRRSMRHVSDQIASLAVPSDNFLFDRTLQETLLFEDESYTNTRMYFWALQSLRAVNDCIASIIAAWKNYEISSLIPVVRNAEGEIRQVGADAVNDARTQPAGGPSSAERAMSYLLQIDEEVDKLAKLIKSNNEKQEEIRSLRDGVFNASSVLEARTTISQGKNIQLLTYISLVFLPASFVTSVFSMGSILPQSIDAKSFAITFTLICGATYTIILLVTRGRAHRAAKNHRRGQAQTVMNNARASDHPSRWRKWIPAKGEV